MSGNFYQLIWLKRLNVYISEYSSTSLFSQTLEYTSSAGRSRGKETKDSVVISSNIYLWHIQFISIQYDTLILYMISDKTCMTGCVSEVHVSN
jgi:hypothetical protein